MSTYLTLEDSTVLNLAQNLSYSFGLWTPFTEPSSTSYRKEFFDLITHATGEISIHWEPQNPTSSELLISSIKGTKDTGFYHHSARYISPNRLPFERYESWLKYRLFSSYRASQTPLIETISLPQITLLKTAIFQFENKL